MIDRQVTIIGTGALGTVLTKALHEKGIHIYSLFNRSAESLESLAKIVQPKIVETTPTNYNQLGNLIFLATSDQSISIQANRLAKLSNSYSNKIITHFSGSRPASDLSVLQKKGAAIAAFHPNQTFTGKSKPTDFNGIYFDIEGDEKAKLILRELATMLNASCFEISPQAKPYLHAAGVIASNYLIALLDAAITTAEMGGMRHSDAKKALLPLVQTTLNNANEAENLNDVLSGPIARGDADTVDRHIELLKSHPELEQLYKLLGRQTLKVAQNSGNNDDGVSETLEKLLSDE